MALDIEFLIAAGVPAEHHEAILNGHQETINGLQDDINHYKKEAEEAERTTNEHKHHKAEYERLNAEFEAYKTNVLKAEACRTALKELGMKEKYIERFYNKPQLLELFELDEKGEIKDSYELEAQILEDFGDFIDKERRTPRAERVKSRALERIRRKVRS